MHRIQRREYTSGNLLYMQEPLIYRYLSVLIVLSRQFLLSVLKPLYSHPSVFHRDSGYRMPGVFVSLFPFREKKIYVREVLSAVVFLKSAVLHLVCLLFQVISTGCHNTRLLRNLFSDHLQRCHQGIYNRHHLYRGSHS